MNTNILLQLLLFFLSIAPFTVAGAQALFPELYRYFVVSQGHLTASEFVNAVALAQVAPGPNMLIVSLLGWKVAGLPGLLIGTGALIGPTSVGAYFLARGLDRMKNAAWLSVVKVALAPVIIGLMFASGTITSRVANHYAWGYGLTAAAAAYIYWTSRNPLWILGAGALAGIAGYRMGFLSQTP